MHSGLNCTDCIRYIHRILGASLQEIELSDDEMMRIVFQESLPTFSKYFPYRFKEQITAKDSIGGGYSNVYRLNNPDKLEIIGVSRVWLDNTNMFGGNLLPLINDAYETQMMMDVLSRTITPTTFTYEAPDLLTIRPKIHHLGGALVEIKTIHPKHLRTIPMNMRDQFLRLAVDDVLISLYPLRHRFENYTTAFGSIQPFFDLVDNAKSDRDELIREWQDNFLKDSRAKKIWIS